MSSRNRQNVFTRSNPRGACICGIVPKKGRSGKGGASKNRIKNDPEFARTRENNAEFSGRAAAVRWMMRGLLPLRRVADYSLSGPIYALMKHVQYEDDVHEHGQRSIYLSKYGSMLEGFSMNRYSTFDSFVSAPLTYSISREIRPYRTVPPLLSSSV